MNIILDLITWFVCRNELGSDGNDCSDADGVMWLDFQDVPDGSYTTCSYEDAAASVTQFFFSTLQEGSPTSSGKVIHLYQ